MDNRVLCPRAERRAAGGGGGFYECDWVHGRQRGARPYQFQSWIRHVDKIS
jgi:hypothetical protein